MAKKEILKNNTNTSPQFREKLFEMIKNHHKNITRILELRPPIPKAFVEFMGSNDGAIFLSQIFYWQGRTKRPDGFFYKSVRDWCEELNLTEYEVEKFRKLLENKGVLELKKLKAEGHPTWHYRINQKRFYDVFQEYLNDEFIFPHERDVQSKNESQGLNLDELEISDKSQDESLFRRVYGEYTRQYSTDGKN